MHSDNIESLINFIYPDLNSCPPPPPEYFLNCMILAPRNTDINSINKIILDRMTGNAKIYYSTDQVICKSGADDNNHLPITSEFLRNMKSPSLPPGELRIKIGCLLILMQNLSPSKGLCNRSHMIVIGMSE
jgi:PIF1-like helicase